MDPKLSTDLTLRVLFLFSSLQSRLCGRAIQWLRAPVLQVFVFLGGTTLKTVSGFLLRLSGSLKIPRHEIMIFAISDTDKHVSMRRVNDSKLPRFNRAAFHTVPLPALQTPQLDSSRSAEVTFSTIWGGTVYAVTTHEDFGHSGT